MSSHLISDSISRSDGVAKLSPKALALFGLLIAHYNAHGKMLAEVAAIKGVVCPKIKWLTPRAIRRALEEISAHTNVRWFKSGGLYYLHALHFEQHQPGLRKDRRGDDRLPDYSGSDPGALPEPSVPDAEVEGEGKEKKKLNGKCKGKGINHTPFSSSLGKSLPPQELTDQEREERRRLLGEQGQRLTTQGL